MKRVSLFCVVACSVGLIVAGCGNPAAPAPPPPKPVAATSPTAEPTKPPAAVAKPAEPTAVAQAAGQKLDYPAKGKTITIIVPFAAGASTDIGARLLADGLQKESGTQVEVLNKVGGSGQVGWSALATAKPDGYTLGVTNLPSTASQYLDPTVKAIFSRKDFVQVANQVWDPEVLVVRPDGPYKTLKDFVDAAKAKPGKITVGVGALAGDMHLAALLFGKAAGVQFQTVVFDGGAPATVALLGGNIDAIFGGLGNWGSQLKNAQLRFLGAEDKERSRLAPNVPTFEEQGYKVYLSSSRGISAPAGTPKEIVDLLSLTIKKVMDKEEVQKKMADMALGQRYMDAAEYTRFWDEFESTLKPLLELARG